MVGEEAEAVPYLPDFYLPDIGILGTPEKGLWVEVKGSMTELDVATLVHAAGVNGLPTSWKNGYGPKLVLLGEVPEYELGYPVHHNVIWCLREDSFHQWTGERTGNDLWQSDLAFTADNNVKIARPKIPLTDGKGNPVYSSEKSWVSDSSIAIDAKYWSGDHESVIEGRESTRGYYIGPFALPLRNAYGQARRARFEHGETPARPRTARR